MERERLWPVVTDGMKERMREKDTEKEKKSHSEERKEKTAVMVDGIG